MKTINILIDTASRQIRKKEPSSCVEEEKYWGMIDSQLYLIASRPDIVFSDGVCASLVKSQEVTFESREDDLEVSQRYS